MAADEYAVSLTVYSPSLSSADLVDAITIEPDERWDRGDRRGLASERSGVRYKSGLAPSADVDDQVTALITRVGGAASPLKRIADTAGAEVTLSVGYFINEPQYRETDDGFVIRGLGLTLEPSDIEALCAMGAAFSVDIYVNDEDQSGPA